MIDLFLQLKANCEQKRYEFLFIKDLIVSQIAITLAKKTNKSLILIASEIREIFL